MPTTVREHRCLLISPSDASDERELIEKTATEWNNSVGQFHQLQIRIRRWEADVAPDLRSPGQEVINREIVEEADFGIAVFRLRLGTPTGRFRSGSLEEIEELSKAGKRVLVYLYEGPFEKKEIDHQQLGQLDEEETRLWEKGLVASYDSLEDLQEKVRLHLSQILLIKLA